MPSKKDKLNISLSPNMNACVINNYLQLFDFFFAGAREDIEGFRLQNPRLHIVASIGGQAS